MKKLPKAMVEFIQENSNAYTPEPYDFVTKVYAEQEEISNATAVKHLNILVKKGLLERLKHGTHFYWRPKGEFLELCKKQLKDQFDRAAAAESRRKTSQALESEKINE